MNATLEHIWHEFSDRLGRFIGSRVADPATAEDLRQDVFLKMMLTRFGGFGYGYILRHFVPRLKRHGLDQPTIDLLMTANPRRVFSAAA